MNNSTEFKRKCGGYHEGFGEYATYWPDYEILCPICNKWKKDYGLVSQIEDDGTDRDICIECSDKTKP